MEKILNTPITRILHFAESEGLSVRKFSESVGISHGLLNKINAIGSDKLEKIFSIYPNLNVIWVMTGVGDMYNIVDSFAKKNDVTDNNNLHIQSDAQTARPNCTPKTMNMHAQSDAQSVHSNSMLNFEHTSYDDALKVCQSCIEKDNTIVILKDLIKSKDETINAKNEAVIALNKALTAKDEALIAKDEAIRSKNELIEELLQKDNLDLDDTSVSSAS